MSSRSRRPIGFKLALALMGVLAAVAVSGASAADFERDVGSGADCTEPPGGGQVLRCPTGFVGEEYEIEMESEEGSGCTTSDGSNPYTWYEIVNSTLPPGLTMTRAGVISGTPTSAGFYRFWVWNHDLTAAQGGPTWCQFEDRSEMEFSIFVDPGLEIENESLEGATIGQAYSETFTASRIVNLNAPGTPAHPTWSIRSGALPPGLTLSSQGVLAGTPTSEGSYRFVVRAVEGNPSTMEEFALNVRQSVAVKSPFAPHAPSAEVGIRFSKTVTATGGAGPYTWSLASGALPAGVALDPSKGTLSGTPRAAGTFSFDLKATDSEGRQATLDIALRVAPKLALRTLALKPAKVGRAYRARLATSGGVAPVKWTLNGKLPVGVRFDKRAGTLAGTPRRAGTYAVVIVASDALGAKARQRLAIRVQS